MDRPAPSWRTPAPARRPPAAARGSRREFVRPADEAERLRVAGAAVGLGGFHAEVHGDALTEQPSLPAGLDRHVFGGYQAQGIALVGTGTIELRVAPGQCPEAAVRTAVHRAQRVGLGVGIGGVPDGPAVIPVAFDVELALVVRAVVIRVTPRHAGAGGIAVLGEPLQQLAIGHRLPDLEAELAEVL